MKINIINNHCSRIHSLCFRSSNRVSAFTPTCPEREGIDASGVRACSPAGRPRELTSSSPSTRKQIHRHTTRKRTLHATLAEDMAEKCTRKPLDCVWGLAGRGLLKITARCSQSAMDSGRGMGGRDFKSKHQALYGPVVYICHLA